MGAGFEASLRYLVLHPQVGLELMLQLALERQDTPHLRVLRAEGWSIGYGT